MLVESEDGQSALLGRSKSIRNKGILTCLSGFIEQGESIEEAVGREVMEEAGIPISSVIILGSQPWPIGMVQSDCLASAQFPQSLRCKADPPPPHLSRSPFS